MIRRHPRKIRPRFVVMNGTPRPMGFWRLAGLGPFEFVLSHRSFLRIMGVDGFNSIYTPKRRRIRRRPIPGLDDAWRRFRTHPSEDIPF